MVTWAVRLPHEGSVAEIGTPASSSGGAAGPEGATGAAFATGAVARGGAAPQPASWQKPATAAVNPRKGTRAARKPARAARRWFMTTGLTGLKKRGPAGNAGRAPYLLTSSATRA